MNQPIKQFCCSELTEGQIHFTLRAEGRSTLSALVRLYQVALVDFPNLELEKVTHTGSDDCPAIEFTLNGAEPPEGYQEIDTLELAR